ncbi:hypothetical protein [Methanoculleus sp. MH98A]|uniref:hypothetical protein n=1 Tax=Methanoculleus sp. MH98A TaxID=1495314 RepID=UPI0012DD3660|nr:hypothetical protein [Methanoculleus sp. MH98A]
MSEAHLPSASRRVASRVASGVTSPLWRQPGSSTGTLNRSAVVSSDRTVGVDQVPHPLPVDACPAAGKTGDNPADHLLPGVLLSAHLLSPGIGAPDPKALSARRLP